jgi:hypothetical protein
LAGHFNLSVPIDTSLVGAKFFLQGGIFDPFTEQLGPSNGLEVGTGNL